MALRDNVVEKYLHKDAFWSPYDKTPDYSILNNVNIPKPDAIREFQLQKIQNFSDMAIEQRFNALDGAVKNDFGQLLSQFESDEDQEINTALENIITAINSLYYVNKSEEKSEKDWEALQQRLNKVKKRLDEVLKITNGGDRPVLQSQLAQVEEALIACNLDTSNPAKVNEFLKQINNFKGSLLEELGVAFIKNLGIPNIESIRLGSVYLNASNEGEYHKGQLIQDLIAYNVQNADVLKNTTITYGVPNEKGGKDEITTSLEDFFKAVEKANGQSKQITINDEAYETILGLQAINIQAKSGKNQLPWNKNKSTKVSIGEFTDEIGNFPVGYSIRRTFELLSTLNSEEKNNQPWTLVDISEDYNALANYGLATVMNKVLHLSEKGNQYLLTPYGFMSYPKRVEQLFKTEEHIAMIQDNIVLNKNTLSDGHLVTIA